ncbi:unnamed protein product [Rotaria socialis]|uniref:Grh/CP2 DB domain-containing protein n=1 Tax=Rotaria socialis TaxID=392032 RepID=A0A818KRZ0_9BILA|nr:unnamed protein product [Rotaria socialis]CAF3727107.1 unnamed protein product [Rotaria socialis]
MLNDSTLSTILSRIEHLFDGQSSTTSSSSSSSSHKQSQRNTENLFPISTSNDYLPDLSLNDSIVDDLDRYLRTGDELSNASQTSSPSIPLTQQTSCQFKFILNALTASSARINEETTTYLNQGQPYEIRFRANNISSSEKFSPTIYRSILRLCFWDKTFQNQERELMQKWLNEYQSTSLFDVDMNLTYGILSIISARQIPNAIEIVWDPSTTTSLFIRFKCTSTDFANKRHGGEKGIPLRIQIDTYHENDVDDLKHLYSCCCKIQLFRLKGAQRKNKADKIRIEKLNLDQRRQYQTTLEYTILQSCIISPLYTLNLLSLSHLPDDLSNVYTQSSMTTENITVEETDFGNIEEKRHNSIGYLSSSLPNLKQTYFDSRTNENQIATKITVQSSSEEVSHWLNDNHFVAVVNRFQNYRGIDLLRLTADDIRRICNDDDSISIRLYNQLNETIVAPLKTLYVKVNNTDLYSAIYLHTLTRDEFEKKLFKLIHPNQPETYNLVLELNKIKIKIDTDDVIDDFFSLKKIVDSGANVAIVGGGFLGSELACALAHRANQRAKEGKPSGKIVQLMPENGNISKVLPEYLSKWATDRIRDEGAEVMTNVELVNASIQEGNVNLAYIDPKDSQKTSYITTDHVVVAVGIEPNTELAKSAGLETDPHQGGFLVNAELQARHNVWVAGDAASFYDIKLGRRRVEHYDHAIVSGKLAGENMTGAHKPYWHQSMFWSDLGQKVGFEAIGLTDSNLQTVAVYAKRQPGDEAPKADDEGNREQKETDSAATESKDKLPEKTTTTDTKNDYSKGVVFYVKENKVVGVVLWNVFNRIPIARKIIKDQQEINDFQELAKLFNIHQD